MYLWGGKVKKIFPVTSSAIVTITVKSAIRLTEGQQYHDLVHLFMKVSVMLIISD